ncbi:MAG: family 16 glycosylhydrolase [Lachnospiraceae bacterium]|nr:family 16 glycosylhydrolase [Lachnospiraceae bacterium]
MKKKILFALCAAFVIVGCGNREQQKQPDTEQQENTEQENTEQQNTEQQPETEQTADSITDATSKEPEESVFEGLETPDIEYVLVWSDEFDGDGIEPEKWDFQYGNGSLYGVQFWGNNEEQYYTSREENARVEDGKLLITAIREEERFRGMQYTSARMRTITNTGEVLYATTYGRVEARIKLPAGDGIWPAFWMLPTDQTAYGAWAASGEIDIMEVRGRLPRVVNGTLHYGGPYPGNTYTNESYELPAENDVTDYHVYAVEWEPEEIRWFVDDICYFKMSSEEWYCKSGGEVKDVSDAAPFDVPFNIILNVAVGGNFDPEADMSGTVFPATMEVDYVRVYQQAEAEQ